MLNHFYFNSMIVTKHKNGLNLHTRTYKDQATAKQRSLTLFRLYNIYIVSVSTTTEELYEQYL